jgi:hypothetical protein
LTKLSMRLLKKRPGARNLRCNVTFNWGCICAQWQTFHSLCQKQFPHIVLFYSCVFYILLYIYISSLKNPFKLSSKQLAKCSYCQSFIFKKIYDPPPWGHPIPIGPGAAWSKLTPLSCDVTYSKWRRPLWTSDLTKW